MRVDSTPGDDIQQLATAHPSKRRAPRDFSSPYTRKIRVPGLTKNSRLQASNFAKNRPRKIRDLQHDIDSCLSSPALREESDFNLKDTKDGTIRTHMAVTSPTSDYALGHTDTEHARLMRQAERLAPLTERFFRDAGIGQGQRVLDLGSGIGDVAMLISKIVGPSGEVLGIERDIRAIGRANERVSAAGIRNVSFQQADVDRVTSDKLFDAVVGRFILQFLPDPVGVLRSASKLLIPGGIIAFQEVSWIPTIALAAHLPLWSASLSLAHTTLRGSGANTEIGLELHRIFQEAGFAAPNIRMEMLLGCEPDFIRWPADLLFSLRPKIKPSDLPVDVVGNFDTLAERLQSEVASLSRVVPGVGVVEARSRLPEQPSR